MEKEEDGKTDREENGKRGDGGSRVEEQRDEWLRVLTARRPCEWTNCIASIAYRTKVKARHALS